MNKKAIREGNAAIFGGAGLSRPSGFVDWKGLLRPLASDIGLDVDKETDMLSVAQFYKNQRRTYLWQKQPVSFDLRDRERKELVKDISEILGEKAEYMRMPTCAYRIGDYTIAKDASLTWSADTADSDAELLLQKLADKGWQASILISRESQEGTQVESQSNDEEIPEPEVKAETAISAEVSTDAEADTYDFCIELPEEMTFSVSGLRCQAL